MSCFFAAVSSILESIALLFQSVQTLGCWGLIMWLFCSLKCIIVSFWFYTILRLDKYNVNSLVIVCHTATLTGFLVHIFCWQNRIR